MLIQHYSDEELLEAAHRDPDLATFGQLTKLRSGISSALANDAIDLDTIAGWEEEIENPKLSKNRAGFLINEICPRKGYGYLRFGSRKKSMKQKIAESYKSIREHKRKEQNEREVALQLVRNITPIEF